MISILSNTRFQQSAAFAAIFILFAVPSTGQTVAGGISSYTAGDLGQAIKIFEALEDIDNKNAEVLTWLGKLYREKGELSRAERILKRAVSADKTYMPAYLERAELELNRPRKNDDYRAKAAEKFLKEAHKIEPENADISYALFEIYYQLEDSSKARTAIDDITNFTPGDPRGFLAMVELIKFNEYNILKRCAQMEPYLLKAYETGNASPAQLFSIGWDFFI
ncbi:tetratricopeptide repeat protein [candidate division KSB1 bacterium]